MTRTESHLRHAAAARRKRLALRRLTIEQLEGRHAPGSLMPIPFADLLDPSVNLANRHHQTLNTLPMRRSSPNSPVLLSPLRDNSTSPSTSSLSPSYVSSKPRENVLPNASLVYDGLQKLEQISAPKWSPRATHGAR
ncbi:MAG: hypothetical protein MUF23_15400 [Pirellula sp.]|nr:hypothetical protein [Pirellula sp.]